MFIKGFGFVADGVDHHASYANEVGSLNDAQKGILQ